MRGETWQITTWMAAISNSGLDELAPSGIKFEQRNGHLKAAMRFRCLDDDKIVYCYGMAIEDAALEDAMNFMQENYGATSLDVETAPDTWTPTIG
jgi:hypothetical protein